MSSSTSSRSYNNRGGYSLSQEVVREQQQQQIPSRRNEEDTQNMLEAQNHIAGQPKKRTNNYGSAKSRSSSTSSKGYEVSSRQKKNITVFAGALQYQSRLSKNGVLNE
ncbi:MAG: hypothetical protein ACJ72R_06485 [Nitrososphaeraceae archaeon]